MKLLILLLPFFLTACASGPQPIKTVDHVVEVPVSTPCKIRQVDKPYLLFDYIKKENDIYTKAESAMADLERRKAYEKELEAAIKECS